MNFEHAVDFVISSEGGYSNDPRDNGGETRFGISKASYPDLDIKNLTREQAVEIYRRDYWDRCRCDDLPRAIRLTVFDCAVNQGVSTAAKILQGLVGAKKDGVIGPKTIAASKNYTALLLKKAYLVERVLQYSRHEDFEFFGRGWVHRVFRIAMI